MNPTAAASLGEFGGLKREIDGPDVSAARQPFELDPELGCSLFPVGTFDPGWFFLGISIGDTALENLILGVAPRAAAEGGFPHDNWAPIRNN